jgi:RNA polymerase sigma factor (sigma-70 family)
MEDRSEGERLTSLHISQATKQDRTSTAWLVARFTPLLLCQARYRMPPSLRRYCDPEDVVADVWMALLPALPQLAPSQGSFARGLLALASTILIRRVRDLLEKHVVNKPQPQASGSRTGAANPADDLAASQRGVVSHVIAEEQGGLLWTLLNELPLEDQQIMVLRGIEGLSHQAVADRTGLSAGNVAVRYHRLMTRLKERLPSSVLDDMGD